MKKILKVVAKYALKALGVVALLGVTVIALQLFAVVFLVGTGALLIAALSGE